MSPAKKPDESIHDLFSLVLSEIDRSITLPNIISYTPYGAQLPFHTSEAFGRILTAGNRAGKTDCMVVDFIMTATNTNPFRPRPKEWGLGALQLRIIVVDITKGVEQIVLPKFKRWMTRDMMVEGSWDKSWDSKSLVLTFSNGSTIDFLTYGMTLEKHGGVPRHMIGFDEEPPRDIFNEALMRLMDFDGVWIIAATPVNGMDWIYDLLVEPAQNGELPGVEVFELDSSKNPYLLSKNREKFMIGMDKEERSIREEGKYIARAGLVFPKFKDNLSAYVQEVEWRGYGCQIYTTVDHGWNNPTAWLWIAVFPDGSCHVFAEHYQKETTIADHATIVLRKEADFGLNSESIIRTGDPAMNQHSAVNGITTIQTYAEHGVYIGTDGIPHDVGVGIEKLQQYLKLRLNGSPVLTISPNCPNLIRELKKLRWATYDSQKLAYSKNKQETIHKKDDHACDALRYWSTLMPDLTPEKKESIPRSERKATTLGYAELIARMRDDSTVEFLEDEDTSWSTTSSYNEMYGA